VQVDGALREKDTKTHQSRRMALDEATGGAGCSPTPRVGRGGPTCAPTASAGFRARLGLEHVRLHDLRHFVASVPATTNAPTATRSGSTAESRNAYTKLLSSIC
jgi:hypothetical protein